MKNQMEKVIVDGKVAVLYSPGYGSGWHSWNQVDALLFEPAVVEWVVAGKPKELEAKLRTFLELKYPQLYLGSGFDNLEIKWLSIGTRFFIEEYDGSESLVEFDDKEYFTA